MIDIANIVKGWGSLLTRPNRLTDNQKVNLRICDTCPTRRKATCNDCGCFIPAKVRSDSKCPQDKWV